MLRRSFSRLRVRSSSTRTRSMAVRSVRMRACALRSCPIISALMRASQLARFQATKPALVPAACAGTSPPASSRSSPTSAPRPPLPAAESSKITPRALRASGVGSCAGFTSAARAREAASSSLGTSPAPSD